MAEILFEEYRIDKARIREDSSYSNPSQNMLRLAYKFIKSARSWRYLMALLPLQTMLVVRRPSYYKTKFRLHHNQHCSVGGRGGTKSYFHMGR